MREKVVIALVFLGCAVIGWISFMSIVLFVTPDEAVIVTKDTSELTRAKVGFAGIVGLMGAVIWSIYRFGLRRSIRRSTCVGITALALISVVATVFALRLAWDFLMDFAKDDVTPVLELGDTKVYFAPIVGILVSLLVGGFIAFRRRYQKEDAT